MSTKSTLILILQTLGASIGFAISLMIPSMLLPMPKALLDATPTSGFLVVSLAFALNGLGNALILVWAGKRSSSRGLALWASLFALSFGTQVFMTQIETGYFLSAFPLLNGSFELYRLVLRGLLTSLLFSLLVTWMVGGFSRKARQPAAFKVTAERAVKQAAWLAVIYIALYALFGYFVAWQSQELRLFYGGPAALNGFFEQWGRTLMERPESPVFQYFRGVLWMLCLVPLFRVFTGKRLELIALSALALGLLPTLQLAFANPLMPATVSLFHFFEVAISTGIYGALCAWFVPEAA